MCVCVCVKNLLKVWPLDFQCGFLKMLPGSHSGFLKLTSSAHRDLYIHFSLIYIYMYTRWYNSDGTYSNSV